MTTDARSIYVAALHNMHAVELQALQIMERQLDRLQHYPDMAAALRKHVEETHAQRDRLEGALRSLSEGPSTLKDGFMGLVGNLMALGHAPAQDEILKNAFANQAFENFEIASYNSLIVIANFVGRSDHVRLFRDSLQEEEVMARTMADLIVPTTKQYLTLTLSGAKADR